MNPNTIDSIIKQLITSHTTISTMESCTSGLIASLITDTEGASAIFPGGYVTYLNETKVLVGVDPSVIEIHGVYSPECAEAMARTVQENLHTAIAIGITGTTGNLDPNNADSVQGVVYFCILYKTQAHTFTFQTNVSGMTRHEIKQLYAEQVFAELEMILTSSLLKECSSVYDHQSPVRLPPLMRPQMPRELHMVKVILPQCLVQYDRHGI